MSRRVTLDKMKNVGLAGVLGPGSLLGQAVFPGAEWERREPAAVGLNAGAVARIGALMQTAQANGALICQGYLAAEWTFNGPSAQRFEVQSVSKSITGLLLGLALHDGLIPSLDAKVKDLYPAFEAGPYAGDITFRHLVTATSGIKAMRDLTIYNAAEYVRPGLESRYHNDHTLHLGDALTYLFGRDLEEVLRERLLKPIGADAEWGAFKGEIRLADGRAVRRVAGYYNTRWTARDLARVGWLCANRGAWNGVQLLPADYLAASVTPIPQPVMEYRTEARYRATEPGGPPFDPKRERPGLTYGFSWWATRQTVSGRAQWMWGMGGNYGQTCMVWPERGLVLVKVNAPRTPPFIGSGQLWPLLIEAAEGCGDAAGAGDPSGTTRGD